ncbi:MAG: SGNH/GDSL hydrolase family protein [Methanobrevibacter sp.]|nr:SGNH/GDSL hydrolase family protein [Methanobrevibacter sp.]
MAFNNEYPYVDPNRVNTDWILSKVKEILSEHGKIVDDFNELKDYVMNYFKNLNVDEEISNKLDEMYESGELSDLIVSTFEDLNNRLTHYIKAGDNILFIGDSWTYGGGLEDRATNAFCKQIESRLGVNSYNGGVPSAGFIHRPDGTGENFAMTVERYFNQYGANHFQAVCIMGGHNDVTHMYELQDESYTIQDVYSAAVDLINLINTRFPNAVIIWCGMNMRCRYIHGYYRAMYNQLTKVGVVASSTPLINVSGWQWYLVGNAQYYNNDYSHPNVQGHKIIANAIITGIEGGSCQNSETGTTQFGVSVWRSDYFEPQGEFTIERKDGLVYIHAPSYRILQDFDANTFYSSAFVSQAFRPKNLECKEGFSATTYNPIRWGVNYDGTLLLQFAENMTAGQTFHLGTIVYNMYSRVGE